MVKGMHKVWSLILLDVVASGEDGYVCLATDDLAWAGKITEEQRAAVYAAIRAHRRRTHHTQDHADGFGLWKMGSPYRIKWINRQLLLACAVEASEARRARRIR